MKQALPWISMLLLSGALHAQDVIISEDFESLQSGTAVAQGLGIPWTTWSNAPGGNEDATASDLHAHGGAISMGLVANSVDGGPTDLVLRLGNRTSGHYVISWWMYVPSGKGAYFNVQKYETPGTSWSIEVTLPADGSISFSDNAMIMSQTNYPSDEWFKVEIDIDLDVESGMVTIDGTNVATWATTSAAGTQGQGVNQLGAANFFAYGGENDLGEYYIDDLEFVSLGGSGIAEMPQGQALGYPNPTQGAFRIDVAGASPDAVISLLDVTGRVVLAGAPLAQYRHLNHVELDLHGHPNGVYLVRIQDRGRESVHRVTKY